MQEAEIGKIMVPGQPGQKSSQDPISNNSWVCWCAPVSPVTAGSINRRIKVQTTPRKKNKQTNK
jgi:hypothetical protein